MISRKKYLDFQKLRYKNFVKKKLFKLVRISFQKNFYINPEKRIGAYLQKFYTNSEHKFYLSQQVLNCPLSFSASVPSRKTRVSRFYLAKHGNNLLLPPYQR